MHVAPEGQQVLAFGQGCHAVVTCHIVWFVLSLGGKRRMRMTF